MNHKELTKQAKAAGESLGRTGLEHDEVRTFISELLYEILKEQSYETRDKIYEISSAFFQGFGAGQAEAD